MILKRFYKMPPDWVRNVNVRGGDGALKDQAKPEGVTLNQPPLDYVSLGHTGTDAHQNFSTRLVAAAVKEGWMKIGDGTEIVMGVYPETLFYKVLRKPGRYCLHCKEKLPDDERGLFAQAHIAEKHAGVPSPDKSNPAGYEVLNGFECVLDEGQHKRFRCKGAVLPVRYPRKPKEA